MLKPLAVIGLVLGGTFAHAELEDDVWVYYPCEAHGPSPKTDTCADASTHSNHGFYDSAIAAAGFVEPGPFGNAVIFPGHGSDIYIASETPPSNNRGKNQTIQFGTKQDFSILFWIRITGSGADGHVLNMGVGSGMLGLYLGSGGTDHAMRFSMLFAEMASIQGAAPLADGEWYHVAVVVNRDNDTNSPPSALYLNSVDVTSDNTMEESTGHAYNGTGFVWGRNVRGNGDEFTIFKRALSAAEVARWANRLRPVFVSGPNGSLILPGDSTPSSTEGTDFGEVRVNTTRQYVFRITNPGDTDRYLNGVPPVSITRPFGKKYQQTETYPLYAETMEFYASGDQSPNKERDIRSAFVQGPSTAGTKIGASSSTTFQITFSPKAPGACSALVSIPHSAEDSPYTFTIKGTGTVPAPEMAVLGEDGATIANRAAPLVPAKSTYFGAASIGGAVTKKFVITNSGDQVFRLDGTPTVELLGGDSREFSVTQPRVIDVPVAGRVEFSITFHPAGEGQRTARVSIANNDPQKNPYTFAIKGGKIDLKRARKQALQRPRRIIFNDDGGAIITGDTPDELIAVRLRNILNTQVDTVFNNTGQTTVFQHQTTVAETIDESIDMYGANAHGQRQAKNIRSLREYGTDTLTLNLDYCHRNGIEYFWSLRMNDIHCSLPGETWRLGRWKHEHPEYLLGEPADWGRYPGHDPRKWWTAMDFAVPGVRDHQFGIIEEVCQRHDVDGIDLDWGRSPLFFRPTLELKPVEDEHLDMMNDFVRRIRTMTESAGQRRGRPLLVAARVPLSVERSRAIGLDVQTWLKEDLVDILVLGGGYAPTAMAPSVREIADFARPYGVPVFPCISASGIDGDNQIKRPDDRIVKLWRGAAMNIWQAGASGVYIFNFCPQYRDERFGQIGSPKTLQGLDKIYAIDNLVEPTFEGDLRPGLVVPDRLPLQLIRGAVIARLPVGEDIAAGTPTGKTCRARLRARLSGVQNNDVINLKLNGRELQVVKGRPVGPNPTPGWFESDLDPGLVRAGQNLVDIRVASGRVGDVLALHPHTGFRIQWLGDDGDFFNSGHPSPAPTFTQGNLARKAGVVAFGSSEHLDPVHTIAHANDGLFGNSNSWIPDLPAGDTKPFLGLCFPAPLTFDHIAWGRDNGNNATDACGGQCIDRSIGMYTLQITEVPNPDRTTPDTGDRATGWETIGTVDQRSSGETKRGAFFTTYLRHTFRVTEGGRAISASGIRFKLPAVDAGIAIDEIELYNGKPPTIPPETLPQKPPAPVRSVVVVNLELVVRYQ